MVDEQNMVEQATQVADRLEKLNAENKELIKRMEELRSREILGGRTQAGEPQKQELTVEEKYNNEIKQYFKGSQIEKVL